MSDPQRLRRLEELFHRAVDLSEDERRGLLEPLRQSDPELCAEVERLLERADRRHDFSAVGALVPPPDDPSASSDPGASDYVGSGETGNDDAALADGTAVVRAGPYRLLERIGHGGMGQVYRAERADGHFVQTVAVKLIRAGFITSELLDRFRSERQILARLGHANIARLLDGALTAEGLPYLAMEFVQGRPITEYCDAERLTIEQRLGLFQTVCRAVQYAHRNLVVHRDLKPGNILVTADGEVKLLDFGIAKLLTPDEDGPAITRTMVPLMTPDYASPEQIRGEAITTATDVYGLGLLLYELLCGRRAQNPPGRSLTAIERSVCEEEPPRPSDVLTAGRPEEVEARVAARGGLRAERLRQRLRGDLDTIIATALRKDPARRYTSAEQLAEDVERHLEGLPVVARPDTLRYRSGKFVRRHRLGLAASAAVALAVVAGLVLALLGLARARQAERLALDEAATSGQISEFLVDLFKSNDPGESKGDTVTARELLDRGAERIQEQLRDQPAVQVRLLGTMARAYRSLGLFDPAQELVEQQLALDRARLGEESVEVARALVHLADLYEDKGEYVRSRDLAAQALATLESLPAADPKDLSYALTQLGTARAMLGDLDEAGIALERALAVLERTRGRGHSDLWSPLNNLAILRWMQGDPRAARPLYERSLAIAERDFGAEHPSVAHLLNNLALVQGQAGDTEAAIAAHERALAIRRKVLAPDHPDIGESLNNLGDLLLAEGEPARAKNLLERALEIRERALGPDHTYVATTLCNLGLALLDLGDHGAARPLLERSVEALESALGEDHVMVSYPLLGLARIDAKTARVDAAESGFRRAIAILEVQLGEQHPDLAEALEQYATFLRDQDRTAEADAVGSRARHARTESPPPAV